MDALAAFAPDYATARERFRALAAQRGWHPEALAIDVPGHAPGELTIDSAQRGPVDAESLLILSSGLHGAEAPLGAAAQLSWLDTLSADWQPPAGWRVLLLHVLNPWGAVHSRRFNEANIDLNRNFLEPDQFEAMRRETERSAYPRFDRWFNPPSPPGRVALFPLFALWLRTRYGNEAIRQTLPVGQYAFPKGLFFGGHAAGASTRLVMDNAARWVGPARRVIHLDFHTGLGQWGRCKLLSSDRADSPRLQAALAIFDPDLVEAHGGPTAYPNYGDMGVWLEQRFTDRNYLFLTAEFGTYGPVHVIGALRAENRAHHWGEPASPAYQRAKRRLGEAFAPRSSHWRRMVIQQSLEIIDQAINADRRSKMG